MVASHLSGGTETDGKRKISVGFIRPSKLEEDTIYVQFRKKGNELFADILSQNNFIYRAMDREPSTSRGVKLYLGTYGTWMSPHPDYFIEELENDNGARKTEEDRFLNEGIELTGRLYSIQEKNQGLEENVRSIHHIISLD